MNLADHVELKDKSLIARRGCKMRIIGLCGSLRQDSWNLKLLLNAIYLAADKGVDARYFSLFGLPLFNPDAEERPSHKVDALRRAVRGAEAVIIACPEQNGSMTAALKNAIEWLSQGGNDIAGKVFFIMGASPGRSGAMRMHAHASYSIESEGGFVLRQPRVLLPQIASLMDEDGSITSEYLRNLLVDAVEMVIWHAGRTTKDEDRKSEMNTPPGPCFQRRDHGSVGHRDTGLTGGYG